MGIAYTIDTPLKVSHFGIDSVISLVDDVLLEKLRKFYCNKFEMPYNEISEKIEDFRAKRITSYLNLINTLAEKKFDELKNATIEKSNELKEYINMLPDSSTIKQEFKKLIASKINFGEINTWIQNNLKRGNIDVNIMTKIDKDNYLNNEKLPPEYKDAHAAVRGFAQSDLSSSLILSAGMNPRLYSYLENFNDFYPDENGKIKKKIVIKVSDYRSALIQGRFLAKKGLWVSEYRVESGLNCGGHAFATEGFLLGPILAEVKQNKEFLIQSVHEMFTKALKDKNLTVPNVIPEVKITVQGGVGTNEEHDFLLNYYNIDSVGWGSPFLLVPEATTVDQKTLELLAQAKEADLYLSGISPLGVPFNSLRGNTKDIEKMALVEKGKPGSACPKQYLVSNNDYTEKSICTASFRYQKIKIAELNEKNLQPEQYKIEYNKIVEKSCICVGLGTAALINNNIDTKIEGEGVSVCPGPNMAYYSKIISLNEMIDHIYGRTNIILRNDRPNMFVKELNIYMEYLKNLFEEAKQNFTETHEKKLKNFSTNLNDGINYYNNLFSNLKHIFESTKSKILADLDQNKITLQILNTEIETIANNLKAK